MMANVITEIRIERLTEDNFNSHSLDNFIRHQVVTECLRNVDGNWLLLPISFVEEWSLDKCREEASAIANNLSGNMIDYVCIVNNLGMRKFGFR